jgi:hypothetical protein
MIHNTIDDEEVLLVQWGESSVELDEISEIKMILEVTLFNGDLIEQARSAPLVAEKRITNPSVAIMGQDLRLFLASHKSIQVLYFSCHGNANGLSYSASGTPTVSYKDFVSLLRDGIDPDNCVHLIMGSCEAMSEQVSLETTMPDVIHWVSGFTHCPRPEDVAALAASHLQDDVALMSRLSAASRAACGHGLPIGRMRKVTEKLKAVVETHKESPEREVRSDQGCEIVAATRDDSSHRWDRRTIRLKHFVTLPIITASTMGR